MSAASRKPWPLRWIVATILIFIVPYTFITLKYRKPGHAFEPYADMKAQANVNRLLDAGYRRLSLTAERPAVPYTAAKLAGGSPAQANRAAGGLPAPLDHTLVDAPRLPAAYQNLIAPAEINMLLPSQIQFVCKLDSDKEQLGGAEVFIRESTVVIVPVFETISGGLQSRTKESVVLLTLPAGLLTSGPHTVTLAGAKDSLSWKLMVR
jgi:hypothetical protein